MNCPFPGMDPYIERPSIWPDFHDRMITYIISEIQPRLRPRYIALAQNRLYVTESSRSIQPDAAVVETGWGGSSTTAASKVDSATLVVDSTDEEIREPYVEILASAGERIVAAIEVLSPTNKVPGPGRDFYLKQKSEYLEAGTHLVEIDLLRGGARLEELNPAQRSRLGPHHYLTTVYKAPNRRLYYAIALHNRLPRVPIPLLAPDADVALDLQVVFTRCWNDGPYPELLRYNEPPPGSFTAEDVEWCRGRVVGLAGNERPTG